MGLLGLGSKGRELEGDDQSVLKVMVPTVAIEGLQSRGCTRILRSQPGRHRPPHSRSPQAADAQPIQGFRPVTRTQGLVPHTPQTRWQEGR